MLHAKTARGKCTTSDKSPFKLIFRDSVGKRKRKETKQANKQTNKTLINKYPRGGGGLSYESGGDARRKF